MQKRIKDFLRSKLSIRDNKLKRNEWVLKNISNISDGKILLDAGCGTQLYKPYCKHLIYKTQDFGEYDGEGNGVGMQSANWDYGHLDYISDVWNIPEKDNTFDVILCTEVLEHIPYPIETIKEFSRLLKPGGVLLLTAPFSSLPHMTPYYFYSGFSKYFYEEILSKYGIEIERIDHNGNSFEYVAQELLRTKEHVNNRVLRVMYQVVIYGFMLPLLKLMSNKTIEYSQNQWVFGYHVKGVKK